MSSAGPAAVNGAELLEDLRLAHISRALDDKEIALQKQGRVYFQISGAGHEALLLGLARHLRAGHDWFFAYYRDRALQLGLGVTPTEMLLQAVGAGTDPFSAGRQMPCHWGDAERHIVSQTSATASQCLPAVGCAEAARFLSRPEAEAGPHLEAKAGSPGVAATSGGSAPSDEITYVSLGEGATSQGEFWESLNTACTLRLGVLYVIADNGWAISVPAREQQPAPISTLVRGFSGLEVGRLDGCDYLEVRRIAAEAVRYLRAGGGPVLLHATVTRPYSHSAADTQSKYRTAEDLADERARDPLRAMEGLVRQLDLLDDAGIEAVRIAARATVDAAAATALKAPLPDPLAITRHVVSAGLLASAQPATSTQPNAASTAQPSPGTESGIPTPNEPITMAEAINRALHDAMADDPRVRVFGQDVADADADILDRVEGKGGVFGTTTGLQRRFGADRCYNTPLAEANIIGRAVGQAIRGLRPCPEIQFFDYIWTAMQQLKTELATLRWRSAGVFEAPVVVRVPIGGYLAGGAIWHSQSGESIFAHVPGLLIAMPSNAADAVGLLRSAFAGSDPVLFLEHKHLYRQQYARAPYPAAGWRVQFGEAAVVRPGRDVTLVTWGAMVQRSLDAAAQVAADGGADIEVIDLRTIIPWDRQRVADSLARTGRLCVVHEDIGTAGFGAEIVAWVSEECFDLLRAPIRRVTALDTHVPYAPVLESFVLPQVADIVDAVTDWA